MHIPKINNSFIVTIVHGKSEYKIVEYIYQAIKQSNKNIFANNKGRQSIQITGLQKVFNKRPFDSIDNFKNHFTNVVVEKGKLKNLKIAIIMDTDDCTSAIKIQYLDKSLFSGHPLHEYILPIHNTENLEDVFNKCSIDYPRSKKGDYAKIFPKKGVLPLESIKSVNEKLKLRPHATNLPDFIDYCIKNTN